MRSQKLVLCFAAAAALVAQAARADVPVRCPDGQAVQSIDAGGKAPTCIPVAPPVDLGAVNAAITDLNGRLNTEAVARMQADDELRNGEGALSGRYAVVGTGLCLRSMPGGFAASPEFVPLPGSIVQHQTFTYLGVREFHADGTISGSSTVYNINYPSLLLGAVAPAPSVGGGSVLQFDQNWTYVLGPERSLTVTGPGGRARSFRASAASATWSPRTALLRSLERSPRTGAPSSSPTPACKSSIRSLRRPAACSWAMSRASACAPRR